MADVAHIAVITEGEAVTVVGGGMLDLTNYQEFYDKLLAASEDAESVTVDLRTAEFIDTAVVHILAKAAITMLKRGKRLNVLVTKTAYPYRVLEISGFKDIMDIAV